MKLGKISKDGFQAWWNNENPVENLSAFSVYLRLEDETHLTVEFVHDEENKYRVNTIRQYWFYEEAEVVQKLKEFKFGNNAKKQFESPTYVHYLDWYAYAVERIADPSSQFSIQENTEDGEHKATVMYLSELHAKRFYVKETLQKDYDDINEARVKIMTVINSWLPDAKLIKVEEVEYEQ